MSDDFPHNQAMSIPSAPAGKMSLFPIGEGASMDSICNMGSLEDSFIPSSLGEGMLESIKRGGGALGGTMNELGERVVSHLGAPPANGDNLSLDKISEISPPPTLQSELQVKPAGIIGVGH